MEDIREKKRIIRKKMIKTLELLDKKELAKKASAIEERLFDFANFIEAKIPLLYMSTSCEVRTDQIIKRSYDANKIVVLPAFSKEKFNAKLMKVDNFKTDLKSGPRGMSEPNPKKCKVVPLDKVDIAIIPGVAFDEKGTRIGLGNGCYDRLIPKLALTTRKVALTFEEQMLTQIPLESHDKQVDIIITEERIIYKI